MLNHLQTEGEGISSSATTNLTDLMYINPWGAGSALERLSLSMNHKAPFKGVSALRVKEFFRSLPNETFITYAQLNTS